MQNNYKTCITPFWYISLLLLHEYYMYMKLPYAILYGELKYSMTKFFFLCF